MFELNRIVHEIEEEAEKRLEGDPACPGGKTAKLHSVLMDIGMKVGSLMEKEVLDGK